jgi:hypothetical protein
MLGNAIKLAGTVAKAAKSKAVPDILKATSETIKFAGKASKTKKRSEKKKRKPKQVRDERY